MRFLFGLVALVLILVSETLRMAWSFSAADAGVSQKVASGVAGWSGGLLAAAVGVGMAFLAVEQSLRPTNNGWLKAGMALASSILVVVVATGNLVTMYGVGIGQVLDAKWLMQRPLGIFFSVSIALLLVLVGSLVCQRLALLSVGEEEGESFEAPPGFFVDLPETRAALAMNRTKKEPKTDGLVVKEGKEPAEGAKGEKYRLKETEEGWVAVCHTCDWASPKAKGSKGAATQSGNRHVCKGR